MRVLGTFVLPQGMYSVLLHTFTGMAFLFYLIICFGVSHIFFFFSDYYLLIGEKKI